MIVQNLRRAGDYKRQIIARNELLRKEIANDNKIASMRENDRKCIIQQSTPEQERTLAERVGDENQQRQRTFDNHIQIFSPDQVDRFMPLLSPDMMNFINIYWKDMKNDFEKKTNTKLLDEFYFKNYIQKYAQLVLEQKGLSSSNERGVLVNEPDEIKELMAWKSEAEIALKRHNRQDPYYQRLEDIIKSVPNPNQYAQIEELPDADKQIILTRISELFESVEPNPKVWKRVNEIKTRGFFTELLPLFNGMTEQDIRQLRDIYQELE